MKKTIITFWLIVFSIAVIQSCKKDKADAPDTGPDEDLYSEMTAGGFTYYQSGNLLPGAPQSPHGSFKLRFNAIAFAALDSTGELPTGSSFPTGSVIVKELGSPIHQYSVMKKDPSNENAGSGWVWAEFNTDGSASFSTEKKGVGCISCHSDLPNRDLTRTFDLH